MTFSNIKNIHERDEKKWRYVTVDDLQICLGISHKIIYTYL